jgi:predicted nucleic acid-binding protein
VILVDTSVWIELLAGRVDRPTDDQLSQFVTCGPIVQEVLQGLRTGRDSATFQESLLALPCLSDPMPLSLFLDAAEIYREGRRKGHTIRSTTDCLIAAIAIENGVPMWHKDRGYDAIARYTPLRISAWARPRIQ